MDHPVAPPAAEAVVEQAPVTAPAARTPGPRQDWIETRLRGLYEAVVDEPVPPHLLAMLEPPAQQSRK